MKSKRRLMPLILSLVLFLGLSAPVPVLAANLYFTAINDSVAPLTSDTMPFWSGGTLYVPYTVFDANLNGINVSLGLYTSYNRSSGAITLFNLRQMLVFDLNSGTCRDDMTGTTYVSRVILRNGKPYVSLNMVCNFFGLEYSYSQLSYISQGYLVRIKSVDAVTSDTVFIDAARNVINNRLRDYTQSLSPAETTAPSPASPEPNPGTSPAPSSKPGTSPAPATQPDPEETDITTYLAFRCESAEGLSSILDTLDGAKTSAVFFLTPQLIEDGGDLVRRMLGTGHSVGILAGGGEDPEAVLAQGNRALEEAACTRTTLAYVPAGQRGALEDAGWVCWRETALLQPGAGVSPSSFAASAVRRLSSRDQTAYLTLEGGENTNRVLSALLRQLESSHYITAVPLETKL